MKNQAIKKASNIIKQGGLVAFPTETVYGLGANAYDNEACGKIYKAKGRPSNNPLIVHVLSLEEAEKLAHFNDDARKLSVLWPGPLSMVLPKENQQLAPCVTAGLDTVAVRVPAHSVARALLLHSGVPIAAPSANKSGRLSPTAQSHVKENFGDEVFVLEDGHPELVSGSQEAKVMPSQIPKQVRDDTHCVRDDFVCPQDDEEAALSIPHDAPGTKYGLESTIIDLSTDTPTILRFGFITPELIEQILGKKVEIATKSSAVKAPGMMYLHYAPQTPLRINAEFLMEGEIGLGFGGASLRVRMTTETRQPYEENRHCEEREARRGNLVKPHEIPASPTFAKASARLLGMTGTSASPDLNLSPTSDLAQAAANLFAYLHLLDDYAQKTGATGIAVAPIPNLGIGLAINDRLMRAAEKG